MNTDVEKLEILFAEFDVPVRKTERFLEAADRRFHFLPDGRIGKIEDYQTAKTYNGSTVREGVNWI